MGSQEIPFVPPTAGTEGCITSLCERRAAQSRRWGECRELHWSVSARRSQRHISWCSLLPIFHDLDFNKKIQKIIRCATTTIGA